MPLSFIKKATGGETAGATNPNQQSTKPSMFGGKTAAGTNGAAKAAGKLPGFFKHGQAAKAAIEHADAKAEAAKAEAGKLWRFWMPAGEDRMITFLDGELDAEGMLDVPMWNEHRLKIAGDWQNFVCVADQEPCPICEAGESKQLLVGVMTICDHTPHTVKSGQNAGKVIQHSRKLFVCTRQTIKMLAKQAKVTGGLAGCTFEVNRTGDKEPSVGNQFIYQGKHTLSEIAEECGLKIEDVQPADYTTEIVYRTADELVKLGVGKAIKGIGHEKPVDTAALKNQL
jgi:hypothetical protein